MAFDSFKGSLTSVEVAEAFADGVRSIIPDVDIVTTPISDGGEGLVETLIPCLNGEYRTTRVSDPIGRPIEAKYGIIDKGRTAIIEMAAASGLPLLAPEERNPLITTTYGTGELIAEALRGGARRILLGLGGSATNDGGVGMLRALGFRFLDANQTEVTGGGATLRHIAKIDCSNANKALYQSEFIVASDVRNPLYGLEGAAYIFAPQKGAKSDEEVALLDEGLRHYATILERHTNRSIAQIEGVGAAGGVGAGAVALLGAEIRSGADVVLDAIGFDHIVQGCDMVVTGEGRIDHQTLMGKAPGGVLRRAKHYNIPTIAVGGGVARCAALESSGFDAILPIADSRIALQVAMHPDTTRANLRATAEIVARMLLNIKMG